MRQGVKALLICAPTGSGKTLLTAHMLKEAASRQFNCWFLVHRRELVDQSMKAFDGEKINYGVIASGYQGNSNAPIQIGSIATVQRRFKYLKPPKMIIWDECHHTAAKTWKLLYEAYPNIFHIGLTATPERLDGKGLSPFFKKIIEGPTVSELIDQGFLSKYKLFAPPGQTFEDVGKQFGDYKHNEVEGKVSQPKIVGNIIEHYQKHCNGRQAIAFCVSIKHSQSLAIRFNQSGIRAEHVDGETVSGRRDFIVESFRARQIKVMCNVDLFGEGFDVPSLEVIILCRPTLSFSMHRQQIGRALRPFPGKSHAIILDHVGNVMRHGLPCDPVKWSLEGKAHRDSTPSIRICPECYYANPAGTQICEDCGHQFAHGNGARVIAEIGGDLTEVNLDAMREQKKQENRGCKTYDDFVRIGRERKYANPMGWAWHQMRRRQMWKMGRKVG